MTPPRFFDRLLRAAIHDPEVDESIRGDLYDEYREKPAAWRDAWYASLALRIAAGYAVSRLLRGWRHGAVDRSAPLGASAMNVRQALRLWRRRPGFTATAVLTLGLGTGATAAMIAVVDRVMIRSLPYPDAHELVTVWNTYPTWKGHEVLDALWDRIALSYPEYRDWREGQRLFREVAIYTTREATLTGYGDPALIGFGAASPSLFPMLGARAEAGRTFVEDEGGAAGARVAVVSHGFWVGRLGSSPDLADRFVTIDGVRYEVVGALPPGFRVRSHEGLTAGTPDVWVPAGIFGDASDRGWHLYEGIARLRPGVSLEQAAVEAQALLGGGADVMRRGARVLPRQDAEITNARAPLLLLLGAAALLLSIAGVNVATLFTADAVRRRHEFTTRRALGASRADLGGQLAFEGGSIGLLGALVGILVAVFTVPALLALAPPELGFPVHLPIDARLLLGTGTFGIAVGVLFGVAPGLFVAGSGTRPLSHRTSSADRVTARLQHGLIAVEAALAIMLLVGAGLLGRTLLNLESVDPGFARGNLVAVRLPLSGAQAESPEVRRVARELVGRVGAMPGVERATLASAVPFSGEGGSSSFDIEGREVPQNRKKPEANRITVAAGFHEMLGIPLLAGRVFDDGDIEGARPVVIVSESLARRYWPAESPIGSFILRDDKRWEVIGVVRDILLGDLTGEPQSTFYFPFWQQPPSRFWLILRSPLPGELLLPSVRRIVTQAAPGVAVGRVTTLESLVGDSTAPARYRAVLVAVFGGCSMLLAAIGIFGLTARMVAARRREFGIRAALGAHRAQITRSAMSSEAAALAAGIAGGLVLSALAVRVLGSFLFGVSPLDTTTFFAAAITLGAIGLLASYLPARRIADSDPTEVLRAD